MSEYTPTTEQVTQAYVDARVERKDWQDGSLVGTAAAEFDHWLNAERQAVREQVAREIEETPMGRPGQVSIPPEDQSAWMFAARIARNRKEE